MTRRSGHIVTFYSYKGGVGRTMALANVAWILATSGQRVLAIDWDLEAPGLHRFFRPFLDDPTASATRGLIDFLSDVTSSAASLVMLRQTAYDGTIDILPYVQSVRWPFAQSGYLDLMVAGRADATYSTRVNTFDWQTFNQQLDGALFFDRFRDYLRGEYDYVLIDSRTGVGDVSGICTVQMPDSLVIGFTLNSQSLLGSAEAARSVHQLRQLRHQPIRMLPVPMKVERAEKELLDRRLTEAEQSFEPLMIEWPYDERRRYWREIAFFYSPYYSFGEVLAVFVDRFPQSDSVLASAERLTRYITGGAVDKAPPVSESDRQMVLMKYNEPM